MINHKKWIGSPLLSFAVITAAVLFSLTLCGQTVYAEGGWGGKMEEPKQLNKPVGWTDDGGWGTPNMVEPKQHNRPTGWTDDGAGPEPPSNPGGNPGGGGGAGALLNMLLLLLH